MYPKSTSSVILEVLLGSSLTRLFNAGASLTHLLDASHRISSRSTKLKQAWLCLRLIAYLMLAHRVSSRSAELE